MIFKKHKGIITRHCLKEPLTSKIPTNSGVAIQEQRNSKLMQKTLDPHTYKTHTNAKSTEWNEHRTRVTGWEQKNYFETI